MKTLTVKKLIIPAAIATLVVGCADLTPPQSLLDAEQAYAAADSDPSVQRYASEKLNEANKTLTMAKAAETEEDMASLAYIANTQVKTAMNTAAEGQSIQKSKDLSGQLKQLDAAALNKEKEIAQNKLLAMQSEAEESKILLAFGKIEFVSGTANLVPGALQEIDLLVSYMDKYPNKTVALAGHTDSSGSAELNKNLSQQRAESIRRVLISKGVSAERIFAIGYGESQPIASNTTRTGRQKNRRIDITFN